MRDSVLTFVTHISLCCNFFLWVSASDITLYHCHCTVWWCHAHAVLGSLTIYSERKSRITASTKEQFVCIFCFARAHACVIYLISFYAIAFEIQHTVTASHRCLWVCSLVTFITNRIKSNEFVNTKHAGTHAKKMIIRRTVNLCLFSVRLLWFCIAPTELSTLFAQHYTVQWTLQSDDH